MILKPLSYDCDLAVMLIVDEKVRLGHDRPRNDFCACFGKWRETGNLPASELHFLTRAVSAAPNIPARIFITL